MFYQLYMVVGWLRNTLIIGYESDVIHCTLMLFNIHVLNGKKHSFLH